MAPAAGEPRQALTVHEAIAAAQDALEELGGLWIEGEVFEYLLTHLGQSALNGQFRTPRQIRAFMVAMVDPDFGDTVYDPDSCPNVDTLQRTVIRLPVDQRYTDEDIEQTIAGVRKVWDYCVE